MCPVLMGPTHTAEDPCLSDACCQFQKHRYILEEAMIYDYYGPKKLQKQKKGMKMNPIQ